MIIIYLHRNLINGKLYIGQTNTSILRRSHQDGSGYKGCSYFWNAIQKYGWDNFSHAELEECDNEEEADAREKYWINFFNTTNPKYGYNIMKGGKTAKNEVMHSVGVYCKETHQYFNSLSDAAEWAGLQRTSMHDIMKQINGMRLSAGKHPVTKEPLHWCLCEEDFEELNRRRTSHNAKPVFCIETQKEYPSIKVACQDVKISYPSIKKSCDSNGKISINKKGKKYTWKYID